MAKHKFQDIAINSTAKKKPVDEDKHTYLGLEHLDSSNLQVTRFGSGVAPIGEKLIMKKGDVLFGKRRAYQKKVAIAPFDGIFSAHGMVLRPKENVILKEFFPFFISSDYFLDAAIKISVGSLSPTINWGELKELEFDLPDMPEQERLSKILWAAEDLKQMYNKSIYTANLIKTAFINNFLNENCDSEFISLADICSVANGLWIGKKPPFVISRIIRNTNFTKDCRLDYSSIPEYEVEEKQLTSRILSCGDLIVEKSGGSPDQPVGRIVIFDINDDSLYSFSNFTSRLRVEDKRFSSQFIQIIISHYYLNGSTKTMQAQTTGISNLNMKLFMQQKIPVISDRDQSLFMESTKNFDNLIDRLSCESTGINEISKSLLGGIPNV